MGGTLSVDGAVKPPIEGIDEEVQKNQCAVVIEGDVRDTEYSPLAAQLHVLTVGEEVGIVGGEPVDSSDSNNIKLLRTQPQLERHPLSDGEDESFDVPAHHAGELDMADSQSLSHQVSSLDLLVSACEQAERMETGCDRSESGDQPLPTLVDVYVGLRELESSMFEFSGTERLLNTPGADDIKDWDNAEILEAISSMITWAVADQINFIVLLQDAMRKQAGSLGFVKMCEAFSALEETSNDLRKKIQDLTAEKTRAQESETQLRHEKEVIDKGARKLLTQALGIRSVNELLTQEKKLLTQENEMLRSAVTEKNETIGHLRDQISQLQKSSEKAGEVQQFQTEVSQLKTVNATLEHSSTEKDKNLYGTFERTDNLAYAVKTLEGEKERLEGKKERLEADNKALEKTNELRIQIGNLQEQLKKKTVEELRAENARLKEQDKKVEALEKVNHGLKENVEELRAKNVRLKGLDKKVENLRKENHGLREKAKESKPTEDDVRKLHNQLHEAQSELKNLKAGKQDENEDDLKLDPDDEALANKLKCLTFAARVKEFFANTKTILRGLRHVMSEMKGPRGGQGWDVVLRNSNQVAVDTAKVLKMIKGCKSLPGDTQPDETGK